MVAVGADIVAVAVVVVVVAPLQDEIVTEFSTYHHYHLQTLDCFPVCSLNVVVE